MGSAVALAGDTVVAGDYNLFGFDVSSGRLLWRFAPQDGHGPGIYLGDAAGTFVYAGSPAGRLYAVDAASGHAVWSILVSGAPRTTVFAPVVAGDMVAAGFTTFGSSPAGGVIVCDRRDGTVVRRLEFDGPFAGGLLLTPGGALVTTGDGTIRAYDTRTGRVRWTAPAVMPAGRGQDIRPLALAGRTVLAGSLSGTVVALDARTGRERWRYAHATAGSTGPRIGSDRELGYIPHLSGMLVVLDARTGKPRCTLGDTSTGFLWTPAWSGDRVFVGGRTGLFSLPCRGGDGTP